MRKTLVALFALTSCAVSTAYAEDTVVAADFSVTDFSTYKTGTAISGGGWIVNQGNSTVTAGEILTFTNDVLFVGYDQNYAALHNNNVVFTFVISGLSAATNLNALYSIHSNAGSNIAGLCLDSAGTSNLTGIAGGVQWDNPNNKDIAYPTSGTFTLTVAHTSAGTKVYIDGSLKATMAGLQYTGAGHTIKQLNFGNTSSGSAGVNVNLEGLYIHNQALTDAQVEAFVESISVPEPTTATLSLLALASLATRRRRK